jgi:hypothetical protein
MHVGINEKENEEINAWDPRRSQDGVDQIEREFLFDDAISSTTTQKVWPHPSRNQISPLIFLIYGMHSFVYAYVYMTNFLMYGCIDFILQRLDP